MAKKSEAFSLWFPLGAGIIFGGASLRWPDLGAVLMATGGGIIAGSLLYHWFKALVAIGAGAAAGLVIFATFAAVDHYWPSFTLPSAGPRLEFLGIHAEPVGENDQLTIYVANTSDIPAVAYWIYAVIFTSKSPNLRGNPEVAKAASIAMGSVRSATLASGHGMPLTRGMVIKLQIHRAHEDAVQAETGKLYLYVVVVSKAIDKDTPEGDAWVSETCALITQPYLKFQSCPDYSDYFIARAATLKKMR